MRPLAETARAAVTLAALTVLALACGGGQTRLNLFSTDWSDDQGASVARVWQRIGEKPVPGAADIVLGVAGNADKIVAKSLSTGSGWTFAHPLDARPIVAGNVVVGSGAGEAFALAASSGTVVWRRPTGGLVLLGAGDDGTVTVVTFRRAGERGSVLLAVTHDGQVVRQIETDKVLGAPAVLSGMAFVPWAGQYVSIIDLANGDETARVTLRQQVSRAWTQSGALWFGENGFIRFDERIRDASKDKASSVKVPTRELPGLPRLIPPGSIPLAAAANAEDKTRVYAKPIASDAGASLEDDKWYGTYFRVAMGFSGTSGKLAWAHLHPSDFVGGAAAGGGLLLCDESGRVTEFDASNGAVLSQIDLGEPVKACVVNVDSQRVGGSAAGPTPISRQLAEIVRADDPQLVIVQRLLLREMATVEDDLVTRALVDSASDPRTSPDLLPDARNALANRRNGAAFMEAALQRHYDFLKDVLRTPPVGPIAQALGAMKFAPAAPLLAAHLLDPADTSDDIKQAAAALAVVAGPAELSSLRQFFAMYRAATDDDDIAAAVVSVGLALSTSDDKAARAQVQAATTDPTTAPFVRERLGAILSAEAASAPAPRPGTVPPVKKTP